MNFAPVQAAVRLFALPRLATAGLLLGLGAVSLLPEPAAADQNMASFPFLNGGQNRPPGNLGGGCNKQMTPNRLRQGGGSQAPGQVDDLVISTPCSISVGGSYFFDRINIIGPNGKLTITEPNGTNKDINIWASAIIIENNGTLEAGTPTAPYGSNGGTLTFYLYGSDQSKGKDPAANPGQGALCQTPEIKVVKENGQDKEQVISGPCGIPLNVWNDNGQNPFDMPVSKDAVSGKDVPKYSDVFYQYGPLYGDWLCSDGKTVWTPTKFCPQSSSRKVGDPLYRVGYFGDKVFAVSYGGSLRLFGYKGTPLPKATTTQSGNGGNGGGLGLSMGAAGTPPGAGPAGPQSSAFQDRLLQLLLGKGGQGGGGSGGGGKPPLGGAALPACALGNPDSIPSSTGCSWLRLVGDLKKDDQGLTLSANVGDKWWNAADTDASTHPDQIVVTTTDYLPRHSELLTVTSVSGTTVKFKEKIQWPHSGTRYTIADKMPADAQARLIAGGMDSDLIANGPETRADVASLTRSIRIVSGGDIAGQTFDQASAKSACKTQTIDIGGGRPPITIKQQVGYCYFFGGGMVFRQGLKQVNMQGVELQYMGQGGKLGHYPVHFHMARTVPADTYVKDSAINESMTRWIVLHQTLGVLLQRNIGWKSIGHGFFLESGTETDNKFYSNLGIFARAAIDNDDNPRKVPGILSAGWTFHDNVAKVDKPLGNEAFPYRTDFDHPAVFWISNAWNEFNGNMAAGAAGCGVAFWLIPGYNNDMADVPTAANQGNGGFGHMKWSGYADLQRNSSLAASAPFKVFTGNFATTTQSSFTDVGNTAPCQGITPPSKGVAPLPKTLPVVLGIPSFAPVPQVPMTDDMYYPRIADGGHNTTQCPAVRTGGKITGYDCSKVKLCANNANDQDTVLDNCAVLVLDHYTSSFHWAETNLTAIWSRPKWFLLTNSFLSDVQNGGVTSFTSGDYSRASNVEGDWALARTTVFVGNTQDVGKNPYVSNLGPFNTVDPKCDPDPTNPNQPNPSPGGFCLNAKEGISFPLSNFGVSQRLFSIYDGPMYEDSNVFLDVHKSVCNGCTYSATPGLRKDKDGTCFMPNAAIAWKQPNGFYYPPSFHSRNLFFGKPGTPGGVDIRHYVIDPLFQSGTYLDDTSPTTGITSQYCGAIPTPFFTNWTDIDHQTELNDDDGSLTGLTNDAGTGTVSVNPYRFFEAPLQTAECLSNLGVTADPSQVCPTGGKLAPYTPNLTATTSPYDYVTTVVYPSCAVGPAKDPPYPHGLCGSDLSTHRGGTWSEECSNPSCYGIPLYRQFLTGTGTDKTSATREALAWYKNDCNLDRTTAKCRWPFVRMAGQSTYQRNTLTANLGTYYLDTSVKLDTQTTEHFTSSTESRAVNVFEKGQTYYMFFVFAKRATKQTYQIYVGPGFNLGSDLAAVQVTLNDFPVKSTTNITWPTAWKKNYNDATACAGFVTNNVINTNCGILQVTIDMKDQDLDTVPRNGLCLPHPFCQATDQNNAATCGCALADDDPSVLASPQIKDTNQKVTKWGLKDACQRSCSIWSVKDLDFPPKGPLGFSFKMPNDPDGNGQAHRPMPSFFPATADTSKPDWLANFVRTPTLPDGEVNTTKGDGICYYKKIPVLKVTDATRECEMPTEAPVNP